MKKSTMSLKLVTLGMALVGLTSQALASGFQLYSESNAVGIGDFSAGAAVTQDASTATYNPAGLIDIKTPQIVVSAVGVMSKANFSGKSTWNMGPFSKTLEGREKGGGFAIVPAFHVASPITDRVAFGFGVTAPFGLATNYADTAVVRYAATDSELKTINLSPSVGVKVTDQVSVGFGVDYQQLDATLSSRVGLLLLDKETKQLLQIADVTSKNKGSNWAWGWHAGALVKFTDATRVGLNYVSKVKHQLTGTSTLTGTIQASGTPVLFGSDSLTGDITLPASTTLSVAHDLNQCLTLLGSVVYTQWDVIKEITLKNVSGFNALVNAKLPMNFRNTWRFAVGGNYKLNDQWSIRAGAGYDQTPVNDKDRDVRLPDGNRIALAVGTHYQATQSIGLDAGYTHLFIKDGHINHTAIMSAERVTTLGNSKNGADLLGLQLTWSVA